MFRALMKSKIRGVARAPREPHAEGSCAIDENLLEAAGIVDNEEIHIFNVANGERFVTHAVRAARGSGIVAVNGRAARCAAVGDVVIIGVLARQQENAPPGSRPNLFLVHDAGRLRS